MNSYLLLRANEQKGPYSYEEIKSLRLKPLDLIWIEEKSTAWQYPTEIEELKDFVDFTIKEIPQKRTQPKITANTKKVFVSMPLSYSFLENEWKASSTQKNIEPVLETRYEQSLDELKDQYMDRYYKRKMSIKSFRINSQVASVFLVAAILIGGAVVIKKVVESFDDSALIAEQTTVAQPYYDIPDVPAESPVGSMNVQNAVITEVAAPDTVQVKKKSKPKPLSRSVSISSNDYKVGVFGGISNLKLGVKNNSAFKLDKVNVQVEYLKPNGEIIEKNNYAISSIAPYKTEILSVPQTKRGVKVKYHITKITSREHKAALIEPGF